MNEPPQVPPADREQAAADSPLDATDEVILDQVRAMHHLLDPPPAGLNDHVRFAINLENADIEVARLYEETLLRTGARATEGTRAITFEAEHLTIMIVVSEVDTGRVRVEGWLAPAEALRVALRTAGARGDSRGRAHEVLAEENGRFVFPDVPAGLSQIAVHSVPGYGRAGATLVTPPLVL